MDYFLGEITPEELNEAAHGRPSYGEDGFGWKNITEIKTEDPAMAELVGGVVAFLVITNRMSKTIGSTGVLPTELTGTNANMSLEELISKHLGLRESVWGFTNDELTGLSKGWKFSAEIPQKDGVDGQGRDRTIKITAQQIDHSAEKNVSILFTQNQEGPHIKFDFGDGKTATYGTNQKSG